MEERSTSFQPEIQSKRQEQRDDLLLPMSRLVCWLVSVRLYLLIFFAIALACGCFLAFKLSKKAWIQVPISFSDKSLFTPMEMHAYLLSLRPDGGIAHAVKNVSMETIRLGEEKKASGDVFALNLNLHSTLKGENIDSTVDVLVSNMYDLFLKDPTYLARRERTIEALDTTRKFLEVFYSKTLLGGVDVNSLYSHFTRGVGLVPFEILGKGIYKEKIRSPFFKKVVKYTALVFFAEFFVLAGVSFFRFLYRYDPQNTSISS